MESIKISKCQRCKSSQSGFVRKMELATKKRSPSPLSPRNSSKKWSSDLAITPKALVDKKKSIFTHSSSRIKGSYIYVDLCKETTVFLTNLFFLPMRTDVLGLFNQRPLKRYELISISIRNLSQEPHLVKWNLSELEFHLLQRGLFLLADYIKLLEEYKAIKKLHKIESMLSLLKSFVINYHLLTNEVLGFHNVGFIWYLCNASTSIHDLFKLDHYSWPAHHSISPFKSDEEYDLNMYLDFPEVVYPASKDECTLTSEKVIIRKISMKTLSKMNTHQRTRHLYMKNRFAIVDEIKRDTEEEKEENMEDVADIKKYRREMLYEYYICPKFDSEMALELFLKNPAIYFLTEQTIFCPLISQFSILEYLCPNPDWRLSDVLSNLFSSKFMERFTFEEIDSDDDLKGSFYNYKNLHVVPKTKYDEVLKLLDWSEIVSDTIVPIQDLMVNSEMIKNLLELPRNIGQDIWLQADHPKTGRKLSIVLNYGYIDGYLKHKSMNVETVSEYRNLNVGNIINQLPIIFGLVSIYYNPKTELVFVNYPETINMANAYLQKYGVYKRRIFT